MHSDLLLVIVVVAALGFDFTNGFHDTANVVASAISTRALSPRTAIALASLLNFAGAFISLKVAATIATGIIDPAQVTETIAFAGLLGAITWNLITWSYGLPSSSSHALIGGVIGAMLAAVGGAGVKGSAVITKVVLPAIIAPVAAFSGAGWRSSSSTSRSDGAVRDRSPAGSGSVSSSRPRCCRSRTGPTTRRRRWA